MWQIKNVHGGLVAGRHVLALAGLLVVAACGAGGQAPPLEPAAKPLLEVLDLSAPARVMRGEPFLIVLEVQYDPIVEEVGVTFGAERHVVSLRGAGRESCSLLLEGAEPGVYSLRVSARGADGAEHSLAKAFVEVAPELTGARLLLDAPTLERRVAAWQRAGQSMDATYPRGPLYEAPPWIPLPDDVDMWWPEWQEQGGGQPFDCEAHCGACPGITPDGEVLRCWLALNPQVAVRIVWEDLNLATGTVTPLAYSSWTPQMKEDLDEAFYTAYSWLQSGLTTPVATPPDPAINMIPPTAYSATTALNAQQAWVLYLATVAHSLALEIGGFVPWSILTYDGNDLEVLLSSSAMFSAGWGNYFVTSTELEEYTGYYVKEALHSFPTTTFRFLVDKDILRSSHYVTMTRLLDWSVEHLRNGLDWHAAPSVESPMHGNHRVWQYHGVPPIIRTLEGTMHSDWPGVEHYVGGGCGTSHFLTSLSRAMNIPTYALTGPTGGGNSGPYLFGRTAVVFPTIGQVLGKGGLVFAVGRFRETFLAPPAHIAAHLLFMSWETFLERFYDVPDWHQMVRKFYEIKLQVLTTDLLEIYCLDRKLRFVPGHESLVAASFAPYYSRAELEATDLWERLAEKVELLNFCD